MSDVDMHHDAGEDGYLERKFADSEDIGSGVRIRYYTSGDAGERSGVLVQHRHDDGKLCIGSVMFDLPINESFHNAKWQVVSTEPLTLQPSILRNDCGLHGYIENGRWRGV